VVEGYETKGHRGEKTYATMVVVENAFGLGKRRTSRKKLQGLENSERERGFQTTGGSGGGYLTEGGRKKKGLGTGRRGMFQGEQEGLLASCARGTG